MDEKRRDEGHELPSSPRPGGNKALGFLSLFIADDLEEVKSHIIHNIIVPGVKEALVNSFASFINGAGYRKKSGYGGYYKNPYTGKTYYDAPKYEYPVAKKEAPNLMDFQSIPFETAEEAEAVLDALDDEASRGPYVSLASIWEYARLAVPSTTFYDYGWPSNQISMAKYKMNMVLGNYYIYGLPRPISIKR